MFLLVEGSLLHLATTAVADRGACLNPAAVRGEEYAANNPCTYSHTRWWQKGQLFSSITWPRDSQTYCHEINFTQLSTEKRLKMSVGNIPCDLNEVRGDNGAGALSE